MREHAREIRDGDQLAIAVVSAIASRHRGRAKRPFAYRPSADREPDDCHVRCGVRVLRRQTSRRAPLM